MEPAEERLPNYCSTLLGKEAYLIATQQAGPKLVAAYKAILSYNTIFVELVRDIQKTGDCRFHHQNSPGYQILQSVENNLMRYCERKRIQRSALH